MTTKLLQDLAAHRFNCAKRRVASRPGWSFADLAERYKVCERTVHHWTQQPDFPAPISMTRKSRVITRLYDVHAVDAWRAQHAEKHHDENH